MEARDSDQLALGRTYDARTVAMVLDAPIKWVDNILSHHDIRGVDRTSRGVERRLSFDGVAAIAIARLLSMELGIPMAGALAIGAQLVDQGDGQLMTPGGVGVTVDFGALTGKLQDRLTEVCETSVRMRRGRPTGTGQVAGA
jgi:hypothetical protein